MGLGSVDVPEPAQAGRRLEAKFQDKATLDSYKVERLKARPGLAVDDLSGRADATAQPGDFLLVSLLWRSERIMDQNYVVFVHLIDADGRSWASHDNQPNATLQATSSWVPGQDIADRYLLKLPGDMPAGVYQLEVGMYHIDERGYQFLPLAGGGNSVVFGSVKVRGRSTAALSQPVASWQEGMTLLGWRQERDGALALEWQADGPPQGGASPTGLWEAGDRIADRHVLRDAPAGRWRLTIGWYEPRSGQRLTLVNGSDELDLGELQVPPAGGA